MNRLFYTSMIEPAAGIIGTGLGGAIGFILKNPSRRFLSALLNFSAGIMIAVVCFDLLPEAYEIGGLTSGITGVVLGVFVIVACDRIIAARQQRISREKSVGTPLSQYTKAGILLGIGIALHNFPEGLAIGSGFSAMESYGIGLSLVIALHDIPEGIAMAAPLMIGGMGKFKVLLAAAAAGIPTGIGALAGYLLGGISPFFIGVCLGFAGGAMLYITCIELIPGARELYRGKLPGLGFILGVIAGIFVTSLI